MKHLVPILDEGVSLDFGDHVIVVMDGTAMPDVAATPAGLVQAVEQLLGKMLGARDERQQQRTEEEEQ